MPGRLDEAAVVRGRRRVHVDAEVIGLGWMFPPPASHFETPIADAEMLRELAMPGRTRPAPPLTSCSGRL